MPNRWIYLFFCSMVLIAANVGVAAPPMRFSYQSKLTYNSNSPIQGNHTLFFSLWRDGSAGVADSGTLVFEEQATLDLGALGIANHAVGDGTSQVPGPLSKEMLQPAGDLFLQVAVDVAENVILPRIRVESVPYALVSADGEVRTPISQPSSFPIIISQPGSYYLTGNIVGVPGAAGIQITTSSVTFDMMGFQLAGVPGSTRGITTANAPQNVVIRNGHISNWGDDGINGSSHDFWHIENVTSSDNADVGINVGQSSLIRNCIAEGNGGIGIAGSAGTVILGCAARNNTGNGINGNSSTIHGCVSRANTGRGINATFATVVSGCSAESNSAGGIVAGEGANVYGCAVRNNSDDGIEANGDYATIRDNQCTLNASAGAGAGIRVSSNDCRVEGNSCVQNDLGMVVTSAGNFISRNTCSSNTANNWSIVAGNTVLVVQGSSAGVITGNTGGVAPGSTDPNANFTF